VAWLGVAPLGWPPVNVPTAVLIGEVERRSRRAVTSSNHRRGNEVGVYVSLL